MDSSSLRKPPRVYLIHRSLAKDQARAIAIALRARGVDCWFDGWEIVAGDNFVFKMEDGLRRADGCLVLLTGDGIGEGSWSHEEYAYFAARMVENRGGGSQAFVIPLVDEGCTAVPPFLAARHSLRPDAHDAIAHAIRRHTGHAQADAPPLGPLLEQPRLVRLELVLRREGDWCAAQFDGTSARAPLDDSTLTALLAPRRPPGVVRQHDGATAAADLVELGRRLARILGDDAFRSKLTARLDPRARSGHVALVVRSPDDALLSLSWEALRLGDLDAVGILARTRVVRELSDAPRQTAAIPGPLRVLVAIASPGDDLDHEHESKVILDAVDGLARTNARVSFADSGATLSAIRTQLEAAAFHVVHLSAHGRPGYLQLEDELGGAVEVRPEALAQALLETNHPPSLVVLSACSSAVGAEPDAHGLRLHFARELIRAGVPGVIAMQNPVGDGYATELAAHFYARLAGELDPMPAEALAYARAKVEAERCARVSQADFRAPVPEYATPAFYAAKGAAESALFDGTRPGEALSPTPRLIGVPGLTMRPTGYLVGRRALRRRLRSAVVPDGAKGAVLVGVGGAGKSSLAAQLGAALRSEGWLVAVVVGDVSIAHVAVAVARAFAEQDGASLALSEPGRQRCTRLGGQRPEVEAEADLRALLAGERLLLLLDNFESNQLVAALSAPGIPERVIPRDVTALARTVRADVARLVVALASAAERGALVLTGRYPVPELGPYLAVIEAGAPLKDVELRRFLWRLGALRAAPAALQARVLTEVGGHPRALEFADALLRDAGMVAGATAPFPDVRARIEELADRRGLTVGEASAADAAAGARALIAEDVLLEALLGRLDPAELGLLRAAAVFRRGVPFDAIESAADRSGVAMDAGRLRRTLQRLVSLTLVAPTGPVLRPGGAVPLATDTWLVHRWTAAELGEATALPREAHLAAAEFYMRGAAPEWDDGWEALHHYAAAGALSDAHNLGLQMFRWSMVHAHAGGGLSVADMMCSMFVNDTDGGLGWLVESAEPLRALGRTDEAIRRVSHARSEIAERAREQPRNREMQKRAAAAHESLADLYRVSGNLTECIKSHRAALAIREGLVASRPDDDEYQRHLYLSCERIGEILTKHGSKREASRYLQRAMDITSMLLRRSPNSAHKRCLVAAKVRMAELLLRSNATKEAADLVVVAELVASALLKAEPGDAACAVDLTNARRVLGDARVQQGDYAGAKRAYDAARAIAQQLSDHEPNRTDALRNLSVLYERLGDLHHRVGPVDEAMDFHRRRLAIARRLVAREPIRADFRLDLSVGCARVAYLVMARDLGEAKRLCLESFSIASELAQTSPENAEYALHLQGVGQLGAMLGV